VLFEDHSGRFGVLFVAFTIASRNGRNKSITSFPMAVKRKDDETVVFSWIIWPSRNVRDEAMKKVMADPRLKPDVNPMPFDGKRLIYGGFEMIVEV
jgi:uncharacterized protein YbaA (DUF1428 family)